MSFTLHVDELLQYTDWQRDQWHERLRQHGDQALAVSAGPHGDGRFEVVGDLIRHIFSAEMRYVDRLCNRTLTETGGIPNNDREKLFAFGRQSRAQLREFLAACPAPQWDITQEFILMNYRLRVSPRKIIAHVLVHEIRHWAQIGTLLRLQGFPGGFQDLLASPALGGSFERLPG